MPGFSKHTLGLLLALVVALPAPSAAAEDRPGVWTPKPEVRDRAEAYGGIMRALIAARRGDYSAAVEEIHRALELQPTSPDLLVQSAEMLLWTGPARKSEAEELGRRALALVPNHPAALRVLAKIAVERALGPEKNPANLAEAGRLLELLVQAEEPPDPDVLFHLTRVRLEQRDLEGAIVSTKKLVAVRPGDLTATHTLAQLLQRTGREAEALDTLLRFVADHPQQEELLRWAEQLAGSLDRWDAVVDALAAGTPFAPEHTQVHRIYGEALLRLDRPAQAAATLELGLRGKPDDPQLRADLAQAYRGMGRIADAVGLLRELAQEAPDKSFVHQVLAETLEMQRDTAGAIAAYEATLQSLGTDPDNVPVRDAIRLRMAHLELGRKQDARAGELLDQFEGPDTAAAIELRARMDIRKEDLDAARRGARRLRGASQPGRAALLEGDIALREKRWPKAEERFEAAIADLGPYSRISIAEMWRRAGRGERGLELLREWAAKEPEQADARFFLGQFLYELDRFDEAEAELREAFRIDPAHAPALNFLGYGLAERRDRLEEALSMIQRALAVDAWNAAYLDSLGWVFYQLARYDEAREPLERAAREIPNDATVLEHLGDLYSRLGERVDALAAWDRALAADPENPEVIRGKIESERAGTPPDEASKKGSVVEGRTAAPAESPHR